MKKSAYSIAEAEVEYSIPSSQIRAWCASGVIGAKVGTRWVISDEDMQKLYKILQDKSRQEQEMEYGVLHLTI